MRKFRDKETKVIYIVNTEDVVGKFSNDSRYEEIKAVKEKTINDYTKKELVAYLTEKGIECNEEMKKEELLALVPQE